MALLRKKGYEFGNTDCTIVAEQPKLNPHIPSIRAKLAEVMDVSGKIFPLKQLPMKNGLRRTPRGVAAYATVLIWKE